MTKPSKGGTYHPPSVRVEQGRLTRKANFDEVVVFNAHFQVDQGFDKKLCDKQCYE
jgi:hypothetical protein